MDMSDEINHNEVASVTINKLLTLRSHRSMPKFYFRFYFKMAHSLSSISAFIDLYFILLYCISACVWLKLLTTPCNGQWSNQYKVNKQLFLFVLTSTVMAEAGTAVYWGM